MPPACPIIMADQSKTDFLYLKWALKSGDHYILSKFTSPNIRTFELIFRLLRSVLWAKYGGPFYCCPWTYSEQSTEFLCKCALGIKC